MNPAPSSDGLALISVGEASRLLGITGEAVRRACRDGRLEALRLGDGPKARYRIPSAALAEYLRDASAPRVETR